jgi:hypothetical protein
LLVQFILTEQGTTGTTRVGPVVREHRPVALAGSAGRATAAVAS